MGRDPLGILLTVRQRTVDQSRQALATCLKVETAAMEAIRAIDNAIGQELAVADRFPEQHRGTDVVAAWLGRVRGERTQAVAKLAAAEIQTAAARAVVLAARSAAQAVQRTIAERAVVARAEAEKRDQHVLDDIARARHAARDAEDTATIRRNEGDIAPN